MLRASSLALAFLLAGCSLPVALPVDLPVPSLLPQGVSDRLAEGASLLAPSARDSASFLSLDALPPVPQPVPPALLSSARLSAEAHALPPEVQALLADGLGAYRAIEQALASDDLAAATQQARALAGAWTLAIAEMPASDPRLQFLQSEQAETLRARALALANAASLAEARRAFGPLDAPFLALLEAHGLPEGVDLSGLPCAAQTALAGRLAGALPEALPDAVPGALSEARNWLQRIPGARGLLDRASALDGAPALGGASALDCPPADVVPPESRPSDAPPPADPPLRTGHEE